MGYVGMSRRIEVVRTKQRSVVSLLRDGMSCRGLSLRRESNRYG